MPLAQEMRDRARARRKTMVRNAVGMSLAALIVGGCLWLGVWATRTNPEVPEEVVDAPVPVEKQKKSPGDLPSLITRVELSVIRIDVQKADGKSIGSGFIVNREGIAVTNFHVIQGAQRVSAVLHDGTELNVAGVLAADDERDIAILQIDSQRKLKELVLSAELPLKGESVMAVGAPKGLSFSVTDGLVSAVRRGRDLGELGGPQVGTWIQTSTPISPGNSGGPLVNRN